MRAEHAQWAQKTGLPCDGGRILGSMGWDDRSFKQSHPTWHHIVAAPRDGQLCQSWLLSVHHFYSLKLSAPHFWV